MAAPSVTYTFTNGTTADATQVNQNFTDIINGVSDGTKDLSISALTCAGTATLNGNINLGNASGDDLSITASLASTLAIKTTTSYDIGSTTIGLRALYLGDAGSAARCTKILGATIASGYTITLPTAAGSQYDAVENDGSGVLNFRAQRRSPDDRRNYSLAASVAASALTITLNAASGSAPSSTDPVEFVVRSTTAATGTPTIIRATSAITTVISSGSTAGHVSAVDETLYIYGIIASGAIELAWSSTNIWDTGILQTTTAEGGAGAADSRDVLYSTTARSAVPMVFLGRYLSNQATAGTWATAISEITLDPKRSWVPYAEIVVNTPNGHGSTNTKIRRFSTTVLSKGSAITFADSATLGSTFTINQEGLYSMSYTDSYSIAASAIGISINSNQLTTSVGSMTASMRAVYVTLTAASQRINCAVTRRLHPGDVVRAHTDGNPDGTGGVDQFTIIQISN